MVSETKKRNEYQRDFNDKEKRKKKKEKRKKKKKMEQINSVHDEINILKRRSEDILKI
jgi:hypothetical protein